MVKHTRIKVRLTDWAKSRVTVGKQANWPLQPGSLVLSIIIHVALLFSLAILPQKVLPSEKAIELAVYEMIQLKKEPVIYWARVPAVLPQVSPEASIGNSRRFRAEERTRNERIVVQQPNADSAKQLIWQPDKPERVQTETPLQNMVAVQGKPVPKPFEPPKLRAPVPEPPKTLTPPEIETLKTDIESKVTGLPTLPTAKPKPKAFVPPKERPKLEVATGTVPEAPPEVSAPPNTQAPGTGNLVGIAALPKKAAPFVPPPGRNNSRGSNSAEGNSLAVPPEATPGGTSGNITAAVIGLNPADSMASLPDGSRPSAFSRAPRVGEPSGGTPGQGPAIPGVAIAGNGRGAPAISPLPSKPPSARSPRYHELRPSSSAGSMSAPLRPSSRFLPRPIEAHFHHRIVYTLVISKPDLPEYIANWTMWFAERASDSSPSTAMRAPVPVRKTLRVETPPARTPAVEGWVQVSAVIGKDGKIRSVMALPGRYPEVASKAAEDLANWEFRPAVRNGEPIEVEVVIEVPFRAL